MKKIYSLFIMLFVLLLVACGEETTADPNEREVTEVAGEIDEDVEEVVGEDEEPEEDPIGTRSNPLAFGEIITVDGTIYDSESNSHNVKVDLSLLEVIRGEEALTIVKEENQYNEDPMEGYEYVLIKVAGAVTEAETENDSFLLSNFDFKFVSDDGSVYEQFSTVVPNELWAELYNGGSAEGYIHNQVKIDDGFKISYESSMGSPVFFHIQ